MCSCSYPHHCDQPRSRPATHSPARLLPHCHMPPRLVGWSAIADWAEACRRRNERRSEEAIHVKAGRGTWIKRLGATEASKAGKKGAERSRSRSCVIMRLDTCLRAPQGCAPLVLSGSSEEVEHLDLETEPVKSIEIMRRSSRRSHHLRSKRARTIAVREPNAAGTRCGARQAVTSAVRGGGAHVLEPFSPVVGWYHSYIIHVRVDPPPPGSWHWTHLSVG